MADATGFVWIPQGSLEGYRILFTNDPNAVNGIPSLLIGFFNTMWQAILPTVCGLAVSGLAAYAYAKYDFPGKDKFFAGFPKRMIIKPHDAIKRHDEKKLYAAK